MSKFFNLIGALSVCVDFGEPTDFSRIIVLIEIVSYVSMKTALSSGLLLLKDAIVIFGTQPLPPLPLYIVVRSPSLMPFFLLSSNVHIGQDPCWQEVPDYLMLSGK